MIPFFVGYALIVWFGVCRHRRRFAGWVWLVAGVAGLIAVNWLYYELSVWTHGSIYLPVLQTLMYPYTAAVAAVGIFVVCLPRTAGTNCHECGYDLVNLDEVDRCPECGTPIPGRRTYRPSGLPRESLRDSDVDQPPTTRQTSPNASTPAGNPAISAHR